MDTKENNITEDEVKEAIVTAKSINKKSWVTNKRIDFDKRSMRRIETMIPVYSEELGDNVSNSEAFSYVVQKAIDALFEGDFRKKIDEI
jgi:hypothetical protein